MAYTGSATPVPQLEEEITRAEWFEKSNLNIILSSTYASLHDLIRYDISRRE